MAQECTHECATCSESNCDERSEQGPITLDTNSNSKVKHVIGIVSGKGGVGKSLVTGLLASQMQKKGFAVGIMDADITGPSIPKTFGVSEPLHGDENGIFPATSKSGIKIMSTNLLLPEDDAPVAWRGPLLSSAVTQFYSETNWGELDYLFIDMPPGTSDVLLTLLQTIPLDGIITVSAPQELVGMIVGKAVNLAHTMNIELLGLVENMAYFTCDECGKKHYIFGEGQGETIAKRYHIPAYATLPLDPDFARLCDAGDIESYEPTDELDPIIEQIEAATKKD